MKMYEFTMKLLVVKRW